MQHGVDGAGEVYQASAPSTPVSIPPKVALLVLGVSRSGTSALARVLSLLGARLPNDVLGAGHGNERGHWEPTRILLLNDEILAFHGSNWHDTRAFPQHRFKTPEAGRFIERAAALIAEEYGGERLIVVKEPRISRLAPLYIAALGQAGYAPRVVMPLRHPGEIIGSLVRRDSSDPRSSELLWIRHSLEAEAATRRCPRVWVAYGELLEDWRRVQARISSGLNVPWPTTPDSVADEITAFLEPTLRHFDASKQDMSGTVGPVAAHLWRAAEAGLVGDERSLQAGFDSIRCVIDELDRLGAAQVEADDAAAQRARAELEQKLLKANAGLAARTNELQQLRRELSMLAEARAAQDRALVELRARLAERDQAASAILRSRSWQLTQPLRWFSRVIRRLAAR